MPYPRPPRPPSPGRRNRRANKTSWLDEELLRKIGVMAELLDRKRAEDLAHEKAPDLATGGSFSFSDDDVN